MRTLSLFFLFLSSVLVAETPEVSIEDVRVLGGEMGLTWGSTKLFLGGGYELLDLGRDTVTGDPLPTSDPKSPLNVLDASARLRQIWSFDAGDLWVYTGAWGWGNAGLGSASSGTFPDRDGGLFAFGGVGATQDRFVKNAHGVRTGSRLEAQLEWAPPLLAVHGTGYLRASATSALLLPLWDLEGASHLFSGVLGLRANLRWLDGTSVPVVMLEPNEVRGYHALYDTKFRSVATGELRVGLPSLWGASDLVPVVLGFVEGGWYAGYADSATAENRSGWLASVGGGLGLGLWRAVTPTFSVALPLIGETKPWWTLNANLRF